MNIRKFYSPWYHSRRKDSMRKFIGNIPHENILDLGSREGIFNKIFRDIGFKKVFAVDFNKAALNKNDADEKIVLDLEKKLPFSDNFFDCCFASEVIEHLDNVSQFLNETHRILKPNGSLIITTPNSGSLIARFDKIIGRFISNGRWTGHDYEHKRIYNIKEIKELIEKHGFKIVKLETFYLFYGVPIKTNISLGMCAWVLAQKL